MLLFLSIVSALLLLWGLLTGINFLSYRLYTRRVLAERIWDLNICAGKTNGGGVNADIVCHQELPNFQLVDNIYALPFGDRQFNTVLCSHTMEHVDDPDAFLAELKRVGKSVTILVPPLWDIGAVFNVFEHKWIFITLSPRHENHLPAKVKLPGAQLLHKLVGQRIRA